MGEVLLIRHCQAVGQAPEAALSSVGSRRARQLAHALADRPIRHVVASPYRRARETALPLSELLHLPIHMDERLTEHLLADPPVADWESWVARAFNDPEASAPGGDSPADTLSRAMAALEELLALPVLVGAVTHGLLLSLVLHSIDPHFGFESWKSMQTPEVYVLSESSGGLQYGQLAL